MDIQIGQKAADFTLYNTEKNKISLSDFKDKNVVLLFFPLAFSGVCTKEVCYMQENLESYNTLNATVIAISIDSLFVLAQFKKEYNLTFELLSDFNKTVTKQYGCLFDTFAFEMEGVAKRSAFVIDGEGVVRYKEILESAGELPNFDAIKNCVQSLQ